MKITRIESAVKPLEVQDVQLRDPIVEDLINAERISGKSQGFEFLAAVASAVGIYDGQKLPPEEIRRMRSKDFLSLAEELDLADTETLQKELSTLSEKGSSEKAASVK